MHIRGRLQVKLPHQIGGALTGLSQRKGGILPWSHTESQVLYMALQIAVHEVFSHLPEEVLDIFADNNSVPQNQPTMFHPSLIATILQTSLLFFVPLFQQHHSSRIDEVLAYNDSMIRLHRICQIPVRCQKKMTFGFSDGSRNLRELHSVS